MTTLTLGDIQAIRRQIEASIEDGETFVTLSVAQASGLLDHFDDLADDLRVSEREVALLTEELEGL
jgi:hypothetical protein